MAGMFLMMSITWERFFSGIAATSKSNITLWLMMLLVRNLASARANQAAGSEIQKAGRVNLLGWVGGMRPSPAVTAGAEIGCCRGWWRPVVKAADPVQGENGAHRGTAKAKLHCWSLLSSILMQMKTCRMRVELTRDYHCRGPDQGHLYPLLEVPGLTCRGRGSNPGLLRGKGAL
jgi:hypothetical protein